MVKKATGSVGPEKRIQNASPRRTSAMSRKRSVTSEERQQLISKAAYYRAEHRGFAPGLELDDWLAAEDEINRSFLPGVRGKAGS
jgi:hypothetical protein